MTDRKKMNHARRRFLIAAGAGAAAAPMLAGRLLREARAHEEVFISAADGPGDVHRISGFDPRGRKRFELPISVRGHDIAVHPARKRHAIVFARRPGDLAYEIDYGIGRVTSEIRAANGRHFFGHGVFSSDGQYLYSTENDFDNGEGVVAVRETGSYSVVREMPSHGVGPHELRWLSDNRTLVVANGGILTHPRFPRKKLNIPTMEPSLAYIDSETGALLAEHRLDNHQLSIRHIAVDRQDRVAIALQYEGPSEDLVPLVGFQQGDGGIRLAAADENLQRSLNLYAGSVCLHPDSGVAAVACPRGNQVTFWDADTTGFIHSIPVRDTGGITLSSDHSQFVVTNGFGEVHRIDAASLHSEKARVVRMKRTRWDNHLAVAVV